MEEDSKSNLIMINGKKYSLDFQSNKFVSPHNNAAFCDELAQDFVPCILENKADSGSQFQPTDEVYYIIQTSPKGRLCLLYEYLWPQIDADLRFGYYKQIQVHFDLKKNILEKVVMSSGGSLKEQHHDVLVFLPISSSKKHEKEDFELSAAFPYKEELLPQITIIERPIFELKFDNVSPVVTTPSYAASFFPLATGSNNNMSDYEKRTSFDLQRLDEKTLHRLYFENKSQVLGHDISDPFVEPHIMFVIPGKTTSTTEITKDITKYSLSSKAKKIVPRKLEMIISSKLAFSKKKKEKNKP